MKEHVYMPNELFTLLKLKSSTHTAFAYSYYYYINYLYRYCKYLGDSKNTQAEIKQFLGYSPVDKKVDYIIKKGGELDKLGLTITTSDYPVRSYVDENDWLRFVTISEVKNESRVSTIITERNFKVKYPVLAFHRTKESQETGIIDGTFFDVSKTHMIEFEKFARIMSTDGLGCLSFYLYAYIKYNNDKFGPYQVPYETLMKDLGISHNTLAKHFKLLEDNKLLLIKHRTYKHGRTGKESNNYIAL